LDDSFFNLNLEYMTKNMPMTTPLPPFGTMPPSSTPNYERSSSPSSYDDSSPSRSRPYESGGSPPAAVEEGPKLYVGNLPWTCDSQQLAEIFQDVGNVELVEVNLLLYLFCNSG
jgi:nucleolin